MVISKKPKIDLKCSRLRLHLDATLRQEAVRELGQDDFFSVDGLSSFSGIPSLRRPLQRQLQTPTLFLLGSVPVYGLCATYLPRKSARHRSVFALRWHQALPHGHSQSCRAEHVGECEPSSRLAYLCRFCSCLDCDRTRTLHWRQLWPRSSTDGLCHGLHDDRSVFVAISLGQVPQARWSSQTAYPAGSPRQYSVGGSSSLTAKFTTSISCIN